MIKLLISQPGMGKTKDMIKNANEALKTTKGNILFVGESNESALEINHDIRFINISEYPLDSSNELIGFLHGLMGSNYDIETIYLDGILNLYIMTPEEICEWLKRIQLITEKSNVKFEISISINSDIPECLKVYM